MNEFNVNLNPCQVIRNHFEFKVLSNVRRILSTTKESKKNYSTSIEGLTNVGPMIKM